MRNQKENNERLQFYNLQRKLKSIARQKQYELNPKVCESCNKALPYKSVNKFCNHACAASATNKKRGPMSEETKTKIKFASKDKRQAKAVLNLQLNKQQYLTVPKHCLKCNCSQSYEQRKRKYCDVCIKVIRIEVARALGKKMSQLRIKRSRQEIELCDLCVEKYANVENNKVIKDGWDADIVLLDYKIAILWNGPWHYKQLSLKNHSLKQVQNRDTIKLKLFKTLGWKVFMFQDNQYTPTTAFKIISQYISSLS